MKAKTEVRIKSILLYLEIGSIDTSMAFDQIITLIEPYLIGNENSGDEVTPKESQPKPDTSQVEDDKLINAIKPFMYCFLGSGMLTNTYDDNVAKLNAKECLAVIQSFNKLKRDTPSQVEGMTEEDIEDEEWHRIHDDINEAKRNGEIE